MFTKADSAPSGYRPDDSRKAVDPATRARPLRAGGPFGGLPFGRGWTGTGSLATLTDVGRYLYLAKTWVYPIMFAGGCQYETEKWEIR